MKNSETVIDFIRHGEPVGGRMYRGNQVDHALSKTGWQQMHAAISSYYLATASDQAGWDLIVSSPLLRCYDFALALSHQLDISLETHEGLSEICFGEWEGKTQDEIKATDPVLFHDFHRDPMNNRPRGAEPLQVFHVRVLDALSDIIKKHQGKTILLVSHAGILRTVLIHVLSSPLTKRQSIRFPYAAMLRLYVEQEQMRIEFT